MRHSFHLHLNDELTGYGLEKYYDTFDSIHRTHSLLFVFKPQSREHAGANPARTLRVACADLSSSHASPETAQTASRPIVASPENRTPPNQFTIKSPQRKCLPNDAPAAAAAHEPAPAPPRQEPRDHEPAAEHRPPERRSGASRPRRRPARLNGDPGASDDTA